MSERKTIAGELPSTFEMPKAGEWVQPIRQGYLLVCCDCCLVHRLDFRVHQGRAQFRAWRKTRLTTQLRKRERVTYKTKRVQP